MTAQKYATQRLDPRWQKMRLRVMDRDRFHCRDCDDYSTTLNVHHTYYVKGRNVWDYPVFSLLTLCEVCHNERHEIREIGEFESRQTELEWAMSFITDGTQEQITMLWDIGGEVVKAVGMGISRDECIEVMMLGILDLQKEAQSKK